jgi:glycosyltransferase involved in cell wall biosynthesis
VGRKSRIIVQHHGERPFRNFKRVFQRIANSCIDGYLFTAYGNAEKWMEQGLVSREKCYEVLEASTFMKKKDKSESRAKLGIADIDMFLWVGRLEKNKDPMTVLSGFEQYLKLNSTALLYMIYQENDLLKDVQILVANSELLKRAVRLVGRIDHADLDSWFSAADYFISGSHKEGSGYALIEAIACGCTPIVTDIPSFRKITGGHGYLYEPGNPESLCDVLMQLGKISKNEVSSSIVHYFNKSLSFEKIANDIFGICKKLTE